MTRKNVKTTMVYDKECPICRMYKDSWRKIALHIAMKRDEVHREWKGQNDIPLDVDDAVKQLSKIRKILENMPGE